MIASQNSVKNKSISPAESGCAKRPGKRDRKANGIVARTVRIAATSAGMYADCNYNIVLVEQSIRTSTSVLTHESGRENIDGIGDKS